MIKILGVGDVFISKRLPENGYDGFNQIVSIMNDYDVRFANLETTVHDNEGYPAAYPGGGWAATNSANLKDVKAFGFNVLNLANNHMLDYSHSGLLATLKHLSEYDFTYFGAGKNLMEASNPVYFDCQDGRVGFIGVTSSFHDSDAAGLGTNCVPGRPGVNPLRRKEIYQITTDLYDKLEEVADASGINDNFKWSMKNGYMEKNPNLFLRNLTFAKGDSNRKISYPLEKDVVRVKKSIEESKIQADCTVISVHSHQLLGDDETPDEFIVQFCHECIDAGADIVFGHGSHILRGIEVYNKKVIFYGLGDFVLQNETEQYVPYDFYEKFAGENENFDKVGISMLNRSKGETVGLSSNPKAFQSIMAGVDFENGEIKSVIVYPVELNYDKGRTKRGWPHIETNKMILESFTVLSKEKYNTNIIIEGGIGYIQL